MSELVGFELDGPVAVITMDDGKANALSHDMMAALDGALDRAEAEAKAVLLTGREGRFCAGFDLRVMMQGPEAAMKMLADGGDLLLRLYLLGLPLVVACNGHALAGGVLLAATGDTRIGARGAFKLGLNEVANGMPVPVLAYEFARDRLLPSELVAATMQARIYDPDEAARAGWLDRVVEPDALAAAAREEAARLAALPGTAYRLSKRGLRGKVADYIRANLAKNMDEIRRG
ncbi:MAG TPA: crotonase/enoyl-CoA hydratase family protein [Kofleriaceae bacterium]|nr:crotonase/enoyl-CoA hydratase family protein [Kofleriaceae bacterium]